MKKSNLLFTSLFLCSLNTASAQIAATNQGFDDVEDLPGWLFVNNSVPLGDSNWFQGTSNFRILTAHEGDETNSFIAANHRNTKNEGDSPSTICNFLIMPELGPLESVSFYTRSIIASNQYSIFPDRLYMVYSPTGEIETGNCTDDFGDFTETLLEINPDLTKETTSPDGYPLENWEQFSSDIPEGNGRVAFVYYVVDAGFQGKNSNYIGIDTVEWILAPLARTIFNAWK